MPEPPEPSQVAALLSRSALLAASDLQGSSSARLPQAMVAPGGPAARQARTLKRLKTSARFSFESSYPIWPSLVRRALRPLCLPAP